MTVRCRTYRYLLQPTVRQRVALERLLALQCELYNAALEERRGAWAWERRSVSRYDQYKTLTDLRGVRPDLLDCGVVVCRGTLTRLDHAFTAFYRRCRAGETPGFPRFKSAARWDSARWDTANGWRLDADRRRLHLKGIGEIKARLHRPWQGEPRAIAVKREGRRWWVSVQCVNVPAVPCLPTGREVGIDLGVHALVATSDGELIPCGRFGRRNQHRLTAAQQSLARKQPGSNRRKRAVERVAAAHRSAANRRHDHAHQLSRRLVNGYDVIVHEDLRIPNMVRRPKTNGAPKGGLNRSIYDAGWGQLLRCLAYKAESAGREVIAVDPRQTSQRCSECGHVSAANRVEQAKFECVACGHTAHADTNAAVNILRAGRARQVSACEESPADSLPRRTHRARVESETS